MHPGHLLYTRPNHFIVIPCSQSIKLSDLNVSTAISSHLLAIRPGSSNSHPQCFLFLSRRQTPAPFSLPRFEGAQVLDILAGAKLVSHVHPRI